MRRSFRGCHVQNENDFIGNDDFLVDRCRPCAGRGPAAGSIPAPAPDPQIAAALKAVSAAAHPADHREAGELPDAAHALVGCSGLERQGHQCRGGVDQERVRSVFQGLRRLPGSEDRRVHAGAGKSHPEAHEAHQCVRDSEGQRPGECLAHRPGDGPLRLAQHARRTTPPAPRPAPTTTAAAPPSAWNAHAC